MKRSSDRILTTHVGSLIRPPALQDFLRAKQAGKPYDQAAYEACLTDSVAEVVRQQADVGIDVVSDGEFGKSISWSQYVLERLSGFERRPIKPGGNPFTRGVDREQFAEFYAELDAREGVATTVEAVCVGPIAYTGQAELARDIDNFKAALKQVDVAEAFLPVAAPASVIPDRKNEYYKSEEELIRAIGGGDAHRIPHDHRCRFRAAARRRARRRHLRPHGAAGQFRRLPQMARLAGRRAQRGDRRPAGGPHPLSRLLGQLAGPAHHRRAAQGHRRSHPRR